MVGKIGMTQEQRAYKAKLDRLQVAAFTMLFNLRRREVGVDLAFASAIADTGDRKFRAALEKHPNLVDTWIKNFYGKKIKGNRYFDRSKKWDEDVFEEFC